MQVDAGTFPSLSRSFIFRDKAFSSPSAALEAYITSELGNDSFGKRREDVENLLSSRVSDGPSKKDHGGARRKALPISQMVDEAYRQLQQIKKKRKSVNDEISATESVLNKISLDNLSFDSSNSGSHASTASTSSLLPNAPGVTWEDKSHRLVSSRGNIRNQRYRPNTSLEQLKLSLEERDKESLLAAHLTSKTLGTLAKLKKGKKKSVNSRADSDALSEQLQRLRDDLNEKKSGDLTPVRISGRLKFPAPRDEVSNDSDHKPYKKSKSSRVEKRESRDDSYLYAAENRQGDYEERFTSPHSEWPFIRGSRSVRAEKNQRPPSWVEDLAASERSSAVNLGGGGDYFAASSGRALSLDDLSPSDKEPSRVLRSKVNRDISRHGIERVLSSRHQAESTKIADDTDFDIVSLTTDDLCFAAPDASNLKSILRTPTSTPKKRRTRLSSSTDDLITESLDPYQILSPSKTSPSRLGVRFHLNAEKEENSEVSHEAKASKNQVHSDYIRQLMKDIEESESVVSSSVTDTKTRSDDKQDYVTPEQNLEFENDFTFSEDVNSVPALEGYSKASKMSGDCFGYLTKIQHLLETTPSENIHRIVEANTSANTEDILNGDRSWEKALPKFESVPYPEISSATQGKEGNIIDQFLQECKENVDTTLSGTAPPGGMEALKNMLFSVQTLVPSGEYSEQQEKDLSAEEHQEMQSAGNQNTVPENLRHLLASDSDQENSAVNENSLSVAMQHLNTLKTLMDTRRAPQMTSTPNK